MTDFHLLLVGETKTMELMKLITVTVSLFISVTVITADYVRPQPRKTLHFQLNPKPSFYPQQVTLSSLSLSLCVFHFFFFFF